MKIRSVGAELFYADGHTDMPKLVIARHNFTNAPKNQPGYSIQSSAPFIRKMPSFLISRLAVYTGSSKKMDGI